MDTEGGANHVPEGKKGGGRKVIVAAVVIVAVIIVILALWSRAGSPEPEQNTIGGDTQEPGGADIIGEENDEMTPPADGAEMMGAENQTYTITYADNGFLPSSLSIKKGDTVAFSNQSSLEAWPASALHPTHTVYPGSDIAKCGASEANGIFDACRGLANGESWSFRFNEVGEWGYHNHINPGHFGKIIVTE